MSAQIIQFPGNSAGGAQRPETGLQALIDIDQMQDFRIMGVGTMRRFSSSQAALVRLIDSYAAGGEPPSVAELETLMWKFAGVLRNTDFAHKFLVVHGHPFAEVERYEQMRCQFLPEIRYRPCSVPDDM